MIIEKFEVGDLFVIERNKLNSYFDFKVGDEMTDMCLFEQDKYKRYPASFKIIDILYNKPFSKCYRKRKPKYYICRCISKNEETVIDKENRLALLEANEPSLRKCSGNTKVTKFINCLHDYPCYTNLCPKMQNPENYKNGMCHTHLCKVIEEYCKLTQKGNNFCPKCGEKLR